MGEVRWERLAAMLICVTALTGGCYLAVRYALPILLPFLLAWGISLAVRPMARGMSRRLGASQRLCAAILLVAFLCLLLALLGGATRRLVTELEHLLERLLATEEISGPIDFFEMLTSRIGFLRRIGAGERLAAFRERFNQGVSELLVGLLRSLTAGIPQFLGGLVSALPSVLFVSVVTVIASFYFCMGGESVTKALVTLLPQRLRAALPAWKTRVRARSLRYLKAYLLLLLLTFAELFLGFLLLGVDYAFLLALLISAIDLLPILGVGSVLIPWAVILLLGGRAGLGMGLLVLYLAIAVLRQILEPRLVGQSLGVHPLLALFSGYVGWRIFGFLGLLLGPFLALLVKTLLAQLRELSSNGFFRPFL